MRGEQVCVPHFNAGTTATRFRIDIAD